MNWIRENWLAVVVLVAIAASFFVSRADTASQLKASRANTVQACERGSARFALLAAYQRRTAEARRSVGDEEIARDYEGFAAATVSFIPRTEGVNPSELVKVEREVIDGRVVYRLAESALKLQSAGCNAAF